ncbi:GAF domain-containing protein [Persicobacter sp. CCB-QB2]|uniref:GAF domain-containing protein n=1 Tax=Persicobacter sp. CCB-QB2 TaxID=1561025 RepID=UPI00155D990F|nr:GAF domain-containing protein [Persicobacter sp. CCB-QB2]
MNLLLSKEKSLAERYLIFFGIVVLISLLPSVKLFSLKDKIAARRDVEEKGLTPLRFAVADMESAIGDLLVFSVLQHSADNVVNDRVIQAFTDYNVALTSTQLAFNNTEDANINKRVALLIEQIDLFLIHFKQNSLDLAVIQEGQMVKRQLMALEKELDKMLADHIAGTNEEIADLTLSYLFFLAFIFLQILGFVVYTIRIVKKPISNFSHLLDFMAEGKLPEKYIVTSLKDFKGLSRSLSKVGDNLKAASNFANQVGEGNLEEDYTAQGKDDLLGNSLIHMRQQLKSVAVEEKQRLWKIEGLAALTNIIRNDFDNLAHLGDQLLPQLVSYLGAVQGTFYVYQEVGGEGYLDQTATYAFSRKKYEQGQIKIGEGLVGQVFLEQKTVYMTEIPEDFIRITSGLGDARPRALLVLPLKNNDQVEGILELASFHSFDQHQLDFLEEAAQSIAMTIYNARTNEQTSKLLRETQEQAEQMRAQEEELRQNMEEMQATHEQMSRLQQEQKTSTKQIQDKLEFNEMILTKLSGGDQSWAVKKVNGQYEMLSKLFAEHLGYHEVEEVLGRQDMQLVKDSRLLAEFQSRDQQTLQSETPCLFEEDGFWEERGHLEWKGEVWIWIRRKSTTASGLKA